MWGSSVSGLFREGEEHATMQVNANDQSVFGCLVFDVLCVSRE